MTQSPSPWLFATVVYISKVHSFELAHLPPYKIDIGDGQTIRQDHVFERHIGYTANLKLDVTHATETITAFDPGMIPDGISVEKVQEEVNDYNQKEIGKALEVLFNKSTPVHINIPFEEPLYNTVSSPVVKIPDLVRNEPPSENAGDLSSFLEHWNKAGAR